MLERVELLEIGSHNFNHNGHKDFILHCTFNEFFICKAAFYLESALLRRLYELLCLSWCLLLVWVVQVTNKELFSVQGRLCFMVFFPAFECL